MLISAGLCPAGCLCLSNHTVERKKKTPEDAGQCYTCPVTTNYDLQLMKCSGQLSALIALMSATWQGWRDAGRREICKGAKNMPPFSHN